MGPFLANGAFDLLPFIIVQVCIEAAAMHRVAARVTEPVTYRACVEAVEAHCAGSTRGGHLEARRKAHLVSLKIEQLCLS